MRFSTIFAFIASIGVISATPTPNNTTIVAFGGENGEVNLGTESGCGSIGPLGPGHYIWWIVVGCTPGAQIFGMDYRTCQATDATGCLPGQAKHIGSMEVDDPNDTFQVAFRKNTNTLPFVCPSIGQIRCEANFNENSDGPNYSLRVMPRVVVGINMIKQAPSVVRVSDFAQSLTTTSEPYLKNVFQMNTGSSQVCCIVMYRAVNPDAMFGVDRTDMPTSGLESSSSYTSHVGPKAGRNRLTGHVGMIDSSISNAFETIYSSCRNITAWYYQYDIR
ncbi:hypothetical protein C8Q73DRAFT_666280 [Cubamyces lactineus]|nr:hypothetical protein C8Q73DRAFT_666280 [Cubamyces lactineus]